MTYPTLSTQDHSTDDAAGVVAGSYLAVALQCERPLERGVRVALGGTSELNVGRGPRLDVFRHGGFVQVTLPDARLSDRHARLVMRGNAWFVEDLGSKNGTLVNGALCAEARLLRDGDVIEVGRTFLVFRDQVAVDEPFEDLDARRLEGPSAFATLSPALSEKLARLRHLARSPMSILLRGETGTGKEVMARAIHAASERPGRFVAVNCGALPETLVESELFGHRKGAFSGATETREGYVRAADRGTLLLDEIAELSPPSQVALLRVLQESEVVPVGSSEAVRVDVRFVAATHQDIPGRIEDGRFRRDLYTRLTGYQLTLPPLRQRKEDLGLIVGAILHAHAGERAERLRLRRSVARLFFRYDWPGNIRELDNVLGAALALPHEGEITVKHLPEELREGSPAPLSARDAEALRSRLIALYRKHRGNVTAVARELGKARQQIHRWNRRLSIDPDRFRD